MNPDELLLRDIHLPGPISWWPPAIGWWILVGAIAGMIALVIWWRRRRIAIRNAPATLARIELDRLQAAWSEHGDAHRLVNDVSTWLRRAGMSLSSRHRAASLTGDQWWQHLDDLAGESIFNDVTGRLLTEAPYQTPKPDSDSDSVNSEHLLTLCDRWLIATARKTRQT